MAKPRILITNDDGINAPGIKALINELARQGFADVFVSAPSGERSAQSHAITLGRYMRCDSWAVATMSAALWLLSSCMSISIHTHHWMYR